MKLGFVGTGNMASAIMGGVIEKGIVPSEEIIGSDLSEKGRQRTKDAFGIHVTGDNKEVAKNAEVIILAVKPQFYEDVISDIKDVITKEQIIITIAPGKTIEWLEEKFGKPIKLVRTMPNTPALVGEGMTAATVNSEITKEDEAYVIELLESFGKVEMMPERLMNAVVAVNGSSPAYVFMFIEAMADSAVYSGIPREQAYRLAAQAVLGSAKMVIETGRHPADLKDMVCSPGGTTIASVRVLEEKGFRSAIIEAMQACEEKSKIL